MSLKINIVYENNFNSLDVLNELLKHNIKVFPYQENLDLNNEIIIYLTSMLSNNLETYKFVTNKKIMISSSLLTTYFENIFNLNHILINNTLIENNNYFILLNKNHTKTIILNIPNSLEINKALETILNLYNSLHNYEIKDLVFNYLTLIPKTKVSTYKDIAIYIKNKNFSRLVGNILHLNQNQFLYPCYKIVNSKGKLSNHYAFGGIKVQKELLLNDNIQVINNKVDLEKYNFHI